MEAGTSSDQARLTLYWSAHRKCRHRSSVPLPKGWVNGIVHFLAQAGKVVIQLQPGAAHSGSCILRCKGNIKRVAGGYECVQPILILLPAYLDIGDRHTDFTSHDFIDFIIYESQILVRLSDRIIDQIYRVPIIGFAVVSGLSEATGCK